MKVSCLLSALIAFFIAASAMAADKDRKSDKDAPKEKKICRIEAVTGSLIAKRRICMTAAEWAELDARTQKGLDDTMRNASGGTNHSWDPGNFPKVYD